LRKVFGREVVRLGFWDALGGSEVVTFV